MTRIEIRTTKNVYGDVVTSQPVGALAQSCLTSGKHDAKARTIN